ncbi:DUF262 domain-containing protein [Agreia sp. COWG]|uniref:GmrSD restriction endonuclease domain-containing protein n=1 Tax=Agreia sp. COWG TaxID=2773266 RepID=UPI001F354DBD|nr:DUF262 domain-containing protein [Agreia sp. COWG]
MANAGVSDTNLNDDDSSNAVDLYRDPSDPEAAQWLDEASQEDEDIEIGEFDIVSSPNDWNFTTIVNFIDSGAMKIPAFQRNYVWDRKRASKLIESLLIGLPVPQVFLYEEGRNDFLVIDGQQRLMTLYFFAKGRFPKPKTRGELRPSLGSGQLSEDLLENNELFEPFKLALPKKLNGEANKFHGLTYKGLRDDKISLDLRTIRNIVVKQTSPAGNAAVFEIFSRLNTGGMNLSPQEIRGSLFHSKLFNQILELNLDPAWRRLVGQPSPDTRMRDTEFLFRGLALAHRLDEFRGSMASFVNTFCQSATKFSDAKAGELVGELRSFINTFADSQTDLFQRGTGSKFSGVLFESFFAGWVREGSPTLDAGLIADQITVVKNGSDFSNTLQEGSTKPVNIRARVTLAQTSIGTIEH